MKIGTIAQRANVRTVRYHARQALLPSVRPASDNRRCVASDIAPLGFVRSAKLVDRLKAMTTEEFGDVEATLAEPTRLPDHLRVESGTRRSAIEQRPILNARDEDRA